MLLHSDYGKYLFADPHDGSSMAIVRVLPLELDLEVPDGQTVMETAHQAGYSWPTECEMEASCGLCVSIIREGEENCGPIGDEEAETLARTLGPVTTGRRLACRLTVTGPVTLTKRGVRPSEQDIV